MFDQDIRNSAFFENVDPETVEKIVAAGRSLVIEQGTHIYRQGDNHRRFYLVVSGVAELSMNVRNNGRLVVGRIGPGGHFGETSMLTGSRNCISARAMTPLSLLSFDEGPFYSLLLADRQIERRICLDLARRLRVSFCDHANYLVHRHEQRNGFSPDPDFSPYSNLGIVPAQEHTSWDISWKYRFPNTRFTKQIVRALEKFENDMKPVLITGETGTGRRMLAREIHRAGLAGDRSYLEMDIRTADPLQLDSLLFGYECITSAFPQIDQQEVYSREQGGTIVLYHAEYLEPDSQRQLAAIIRKNNCAADVGSANPLLNTRIILICTDRISRQDGQDRLLPSLYALLAKNHFRTAPLRMHRRDIPKLVGYYLKCFCRQYGKKIEEVEERTMGMFMNYDWPGNFTEMSSVIQRAVILGKSNEPLNDHILQGLPRTEGKWEFNLLRLLPVRKFVVSGLFPLLPRVVIGLFLVFVIAVLLFGPSGSEENIGLTLSWKIGWPLLIFSFFFLARTWCSVCGLAVPGWLAQKIVRPERPTPEFIRRYSGWIMTVLCLLLFWIEIAGNAYQSPLLTASIILAITCGALFFSIFFQRRVWCRYLCPLGALNALFSMPSILELRANTRVCTNRCTEHLCYIGTDTTIGCPMFRHPFLVDNNRDCILCGQCVKNCRLNSIHLNLRLAPQELWNQQAPRLADSILAVSLAAVFYPFVIRQKYPEITGKLANALGIPEQGHTLAVSIIFLGCISIYLGGYAILSGFIGKITGNSTKKTAAILGYGMIPLVLGAFLAAHLEIFAIGILQLADYVREMLGMARLYQAHRTISSDAIWLLQFLSITGGLAASLYATRRIIKRLLPDSRPPLKVLLIPFSLLCLSALAYLVLC